MAYIVFLFFIAAFYFLIRQQALKNLDYSPKNNPKSYKKIPEKSIKRLVCIGDSITCGNVSYNYVNILDKKLASRSFDVINAGINGSLVWTALQNIDHIIACQPTHATILLGSNDIPCVLDKKKEKSYWRLGRIPHGYQMTADVYLQNIRQLVRTLKTVEGIHIALCSPPVIGEDLQHPANLTIAACLQEIKTIAGQENTRYLPVHEDMAQTLQQTPPYKNVLSLSKHYSNWPATIAYLQYRFMGKTWDQIADSNGLKLTVDGIHLNSEGGNIVIRNIMKFLAEPE